MPVEIIQFFCIPTLGICYRIKNYWVHCFLAAMFSHYTSVVIFIRDGLVYVGHHENASVFAWGTGSKETVAQRRENAQTFANNMAAANNLFALLQSHNDQQPPSPRNEESGDEAEGDPDNVDVAGVNVQLTNTGFGVSRELIVNRDIEKGGDGNIEEIHCSTTNFDNVLDVSPQNRQELPEQDQP